MKCAYCDSDVWQADQFCGKCGAPVSSAVEPGAGGPSAGSGANASDAALAQAARALLREGRKIDAVKLVRERTGFGLKEAKDYVESL